MLLYKKLLLMTFGTTLVLGISSSDTEKHTRCGMLSLDAKLLTLTMLSFQRLCDRSSVVNSNEAEGRLWS